MRGARSLGLLLLGIGLALVLIQFPSPQTSSAAREIRIEASSFAYTPSSISVNPGDRVNLELLSTDVVHGLYLDGYGISVTADPGQTGRLTFVADRTGTFRFRCNVTCGTLHPFMIGRITVGQNLALLRAVGLAFLAGAAVLSAPRTAAVP